MKTGIRSCLRVTALAMLCALLATAAMAQAYPTKAIKVIVPFVAGGATDLVARAIAIDMSKTLGQPVVVENRPGNAGAVGADVVAKSLPDGYTLCLCTVGSLVTAPLLNPTVPYRTLRDLAPVSMVNTVELGLFARGSLSASNLPEFVALAKASPGKQSVVALAAGEVDIFVGGLQSALPLMKAGRVKALAMTGLQRSKLAPEIATATESFPGYEHSVWSGVVVPAGTSPAIIARLQESIAAAVKQPVVREIFEQNGVLAIGGSPAEFAAVIQRDTAKYTEVQKRAGATPP